MNEIDELIDNNKIYYNFITQNITPKPTIDDFKNKKYYSNFLTFINNKDNNFQIKTINLLNDYDNEFWLYEAVLAFNTLINEIKDERIQLKNINSFLTSEKLLWGFTGFMKSATNESLIKHQNSLKYIELITKEEIIDNLITKELESYECFK